MKVKKRSIVRSFEDGKDDVVMDGINNNNNNNNMMMMLMMMMMLRMMKTRTMRNIKTTGKRKQKSRKTHRLCRHHRSIGAIARWRSRKH